MLNTQAYVLLAGDPSAWDEQFRRLAGPDAGDLLAMQREQHERGKRSAELVRDGHGAWYVRSPSSLDSNSILAQIIVRGGTLDGTIWAAVTWGVEWALADPRNREFYAYRAMLGEPEDVEGVVEFAREHALHVAESQLRTVTAAERRNPGSIGDEAERPIPDAPSYKAPWFRPDLSHLPQQDGSDASAERQPFPADLLDSLGLEAVPEGTRLGLVPVADALQGTNGALQSCSWCHELNAPGEQTCRKCGHRADRARMHCDCGRTGCLAPGTEIRRGRSEGYGWK
jgi:hypothetical protein